MPLLVEARSEQLHPASPADILRPSWTLGIERTWCFAARHGPSKLKTADKAESSNQEEETMLNSKLLRIKELIQEKEKVDAELAQLIGESEKPKRGRRKKEENDSAPPPASAQP